MKRRDERQAGLTFFGTLLVLVIVGFFAYLAIKLVPIYLEHFNVVSSLRSLEQEENAGSLSAGEIKSSLLNRLQINDVKHVNARNIKITRDGGSYVVTVDYEVREQFYGNIYLLASFDESVTLPSH